MSKQDSQTIEEKEEEEVGNSVNNHGLELQLPSSMTTPFIRSPRPQTNRPSNRWLPNARCREPKENYANAHPSTSAIRFINFEDSISISNTMGVIGYLRYNPTALLRFDGCRLDKA